MAILCLKDNTYLRMFNIFVERQASKMQKLYPMPQGGFSCYPGLEAKLPLGVLAQSELMHFPAVGLNQQTLFVYQIFSLV